MPKHGAKECGGIPTVKHKTLLRWSWVGQPMAIEFKDAAEHFRDVTEFPFSQPLIRQFNAGEFADFIMNCNCLYDFAQCGNVGREAVE